MPSVSGRRGAHDGFTLVELMVVVLVLGILMAIAIPAFLGTDNAANDSAAQSSVTNAVTDEQSYYAANQLFSNDTAGLDASLPWGTGVASGVLVLSVGADSASPTPGTFVATGGSTGSAYELTAQSKSGACYWAFEDRGGASPILAFMFSPWTHHPTCDVFPSPPTSGGAVGRTGAVVTPNSWETAW